MIFSVIVNHKKGLLAELRRNLPEVRSIKDLKKSWPNKLYLVAEMREPRYVWQTGQNFYLLDQDGVVFQQIESYTPEAFTQILVVDSFGAQVRSGETLPIAAALEFIVQIKADWPRSINETNYTYFSLPAARSKDIIVKTGIGFGIYFDMGRDVAEQLSDLKLVLRQQILPETYTGLSYIDLRLPTMAYYCYKDAPCAPEYATSTSPIN